MNNRIFFTIVSFLMTLTPVMAQQKIIQPSVRGTKVTQTAGRQQLGDFAPEFAHLNDDILFGEVWSRNDLLSLRDRSLVSNNLAHLSGHYRQFAEIPPHDGETKRHNPYRNSRNHNPHSILRRLAESMGSVQPRQRGMERRHKG